MKPRPYVTITQFNSGHDQWFKENATGDIFITRRWRDSGKQVGRDATYSDATTNFRYTFTSDTDAMLFKLTFGGKLS